MTNDDMKGALETAKPWVKANQDDKPLVIVDTLETVHPERAQASYADDYKVGGLLRSLLAPSGTVVAVHHSRKGESEDFLESVSGTFGLAGSVDTIITLSRKRSEPGGVLSVTGRDVDETTYQLNFDNGLWSPVGSDLTEAAQRAKTRNLGANMQQTLDLINAGQATTSREVAEYLDVSETTARKYLSRLRTHGVRPDCED